jgi:hypothetical protein
MLGGDGRSRFRGRNVERGLLVLDGQVGDVLDAGSFDGIVGEVDDHFKRLEKSAADDHTNRNARATSNLDRGATAVGHATVHGDIPRKAQVEDDGKLGGALVVLVAFDNTGEDDGTTVSDDFDENPGVHLDNRAEELEIADVDSRASINDTGEKDGLAIAERFAKRKLDMWKHAIDRKVKSRLPTAGLEEDSNAVEDGRRVGRVVLIRFLGGAVVRIEGEKGFGGVLVLHDGS